MCVDIPHRQLFPSVESGQASDHSKRHAPEFLGQNHKRGEISTQGTWPWKPVAMLWRCGKVTRRCADQQLSCVSPMVSTSPQTRGVWATLWRTLTSSLWARPLTQRQAIFSPGPMRAANLSAKFTWFKHPDGNAVCYTTTDEQNNTDFFQTCLYKNHFCWLKKKRPINDASQFLLELYPINSWVSGKYWVKNTVVKLLTYQTSQVS